VGLNDLGVYVENTACWTLWLRSVEGLRQEYYTAHDRSITLCLTGAGVQSLLQPKASGGMVENGSLCERRTRFSFQRCARGV